MEVEANMEIPVTDNSEKKRNFKIDFTELFGEDHDDEPEQELVVVPDNPRRRKSKKERKLVKEDDPPSVSSCGEDLSSKNVHDLKSTIDRMHKTLSTLSGKLPDGGAKLKANLQAHEDELKRRLDCRSHEVSNGFERPIHPESSSINGALDESKGAEVSSQPHSMSNFASIFLKKLENGSPKSEQNTSNQASNALVDEISYINPCGKSKRKSAEKNLESERAKHGLGSKNFHAWKPEERSPRCRGKYKRLNEMLAGTCSSMGSLPHVEEKTDGLATDNDDSQALNYNESKNEKEGHPVVLVDEEEPGFIQRKQEVKELPTKPSEGKIYYPSRDDPESLEILRSELKCLEPGECLTSTIMNFYVRYLQEYCSQPDLLDSYFFNTYFYSKLQEAVAYQKSDKEAFFMKFRRWWKGVNIFQKAYIFLPINENNHWSLVIICIPDEEGESGLTLLHLDSLGWHCSASIFDNIKR